MLCCGLPLPSQVPHLDAKGEGDRFFRELGAGFVICKSIDAFLNGTQRNIGRNEFFFQKANTAI